MTRLPSKLLAETTDEALPVFRQQVSARIPPRMNEPAPASAPSPAPAPLLSDAQEATRPTPWYLSAWFGFLLAAAFLYTGSKLPLARYISPEHGLGYALGIIGGSLMLMILLYPARKRLTRIGFPGSIKAWFTAHMVLGIVGPIIILYHSNFSLGALNSNVALYAMLLVSGSGIIGRYFYTRVHSGLTERRNHQTDLRAGASELRKKVSGSQFVPTLLNKIDEAEARVLSCKRHSVHALSRPLYVTALTYLEQWRLTRAAKDELRAAARKSRVLAQQHTHFSKAVRLYIKRRLQAARQVAEFESYERLFSVWHLLHLPLFFLLLVAGIVHVVAVHVY